MARPRVTWDEGKDEANRRKHGIGFREALEALADPFALSTPDPRHSWTEDRWSTVGRSARGNLVRVTTADVGSTIRIISARPATAGERHEYEEGT